MLVANGERIPFLRHLPKLQFLTRYSGYQAHSRTRKKPIVMTKTPQVAGVAPGRRLVSAFRLTVPAHSRRWLVRTAGQTLSSHRCQSCRPSSRHQSRPGLLETCACHTGTSTSSGTSALVTLKSPFISLGRKGISSITTTLSMIPNVKSGRGLTEVKKSRRMTRRCPCSVHRVNRWCSAFHVLATRYEYLCRDSDSVQGW